MTNNIATGKSQLVCKYEWELTGIENKTMTILSKVLKFNEEDSFRAGLRNNTTALHQSTLLFITTNLNKMGMKAVKVVFSSNRNPKCRTMGLLKSKDGQNNLIDGSVQLFTAPLITAITGEITYTFEIYMAGIVENFQVQQIDCLISQQLISSIYKDGTDFEFIFGKMKISVHKFILAARSPVFAAKFDSEGGMELIEERINWYDSDSVAQFLVFIYTGKLFGRVIRRQLVELTKKYQIKTLEALCGAASYDIDGDQMMELSLQLNREAEQFPVEIKPEADSCMVLQQKAVSLDFAWNPEKWTETDHWTGTYTSEPFEYRGRKLFRVQIKSTNRPSNNVKEEFLDIDGCARWRPVTVYELTWIVLRYPSEKTALRIESVSYTATLGRREKPLEKMQEKLTTDGELVQVFTSTSNGHVSFPFSVNFHVKLVSTVEQITNSLVDSTWADQLWASVINKKLTDVELLVGEKTFSAHRSLLSIRSPVFAAMFNSGMKEAKTGQVRVEDVNPNTFGHFLYFLYTGTLEPAADKEELYPLADRYQVETLVNLCRPASEPVDVDGITKAYLSC